MPGLHPWDLRQRLRTVGEGRPPVWQRGIRALPPVCAPSSPTSNCDGNLHTQYVFRVFSPAPISRYPSQACSSCIAGKYAAVVNATGCIACTLGTYQDLTGQPACKT